MRTGLSAKIAEECIYLRDLNSAAKVHLILIDFSIERFFF